MAIVYVDNTSTVTLSGLQNAITSAYINDATVTLTVLDSDGAEVAGETWPVTMAYIATSNGNYRASIDATLTAGGKYDAVVNVVSGDSSANWIVPLTAIERV